MNAAGKNPNVPDAAARRVLERLVSEATCELFLAYGQLIHRQAGVGRGPRPPEKVAIGSIADVRGAMVDGRVPTGRLLLASEFDFIALTHPARAQGKQLVATAPGDWLFIRDWAKELANQLLGRVTNRLVNYGVSISPGRCTALTGTVVDAEFGAQKAPTFRFVSGRFAVSVGLDLILPPRAEAALAVAAPRYASVEGTVLFLDPDPTK